MSLLRQKYEFAESFYDMKNNLVYGYLKPMTRQKFITVPKYKNLRNILRITLQIFMYDPIFRNLLTSLIHITNNVKIYNSVTWHSVCQQQHEPFVN